MKANELRIGNLVLFDGKIYKIRNIFLKHLDIENIKNYKIYSHVYIENIKPITLTEELLLKFGFSVINENSAGKRYGYVINGIFSSDLTFIFWKATKEAGKFFRKDLEIKSVHQLQNLYLALTGEELTLKQ